MPLVSFFLTIVDIISSLSFHHNRHYDLFLFSFPLSLPFALLFLVITFRVCVSKPSPSLFLLWGLGAGCCNTISPDHLSGPCVSAFVNCHQKKTDKKQIIIHNAVAEATRKTLPPSSGSRSIFARLAFRFVQIPQDRLWGSPARNNRTVTKRGWKREPRLPCPVYNYLLYRWRVQAWSSSEPSQPTSSSRVFSPLLAASFVRWGMHISGWWFSATSTRLRRKRDDKTVDSDWQSSNRPLYRAEPACERVKKKKNRASEQLSSSLKI